MAARLGDAVPDAEVDVEIRRRFVTSFARFSANATSAAGAEELLSAALAVLAELTGARAAIALLRENDATVRRATLGEVLHLPNGTTLEALVEVDGRHVSAVGDRDREARPIHVLALRHDGELLGALCWSETDRETLARKSWKLDLIATRTADALAELRARHRLEQAVRARDHVLSVVAHDLRNPLGIVTMAASVLRQRLNDSSAKRTVDRILRASQRAESLVRDLVEVGTIEAGRFTVQTRALDPASLVLAAIDSQQGAAARASVILATDISPALPMVEADEERVLEVLENLIGNALKFTAAGDSITVGASAHGNDIQFFVKDTGQGIPAEQLPHLFDRFWQARKTDRRGAGLGLTICKGIVEAHGGRMSVESRVGFGTTMCFNIPAATGASQRAAGEVANILIVDDRAENLLSLKAILEQPDYRVVTAQSGDEALRLALRERFAVALIDIAMPGMDGLEVAAHMKELERSRHTPIIFVTAFGDDPHEIHRAYAAGGVDYLVKPLDPEIVRKKVAVFVDLSRRRDGSQPQPDAP
jgi:signal transduction histidine kinase